ncbi:hypothetical protein D6774_03725 [Candidatus Woesearchaeota archaeon]|nr:MAG: hypothetical protein D6774_03725 [Candidatus Woesearchaeota archaeon]
MVCFHPSFWEDAKKSQEELGRTCRHPTKKIKLRVEVLGSGKKLLMAIITLVIVITPFRY